MYQPHLPPFHPTQRPLLFSPCPWMAKARLLCVPASQRLIKQCTLPFGATATGAQMLPSSTRRARKTSGPWKRTNFPGRAKQRSLPLCLPVQSKYRRKRKLRMCFFLCLFCFNRVSSLTTHFSKRGRNPCRWGSGCLSKCGRTGRRRKIFFTTFMNELFFPSHAKTDLAVKLLGDFE